MIAVSVCDAGLRRRILAMQGRCFARLIFGTWSVDGAAARWPPSRGLLAAAEIPYAAAVRRRNQHYDRPDACQRVPVPVVSVGNLTLGGTGKTPMVEWLARWFQAQGVRVALVSRGYGSRAGRPNDEALELAQCLPGVPHVQNPDRVAAARQAIDAHQAQLILLDDGFQHRRLARDLDLVLVDALEPVGFGHVFPAAPCESPCRASAGAGHCAGSSGPGQHDGARTDPATGYSIRPARPLVGNANARPRADGGRRADDWLWELRWPACGGIRGHRQSGGLSPATG